MKTGLEEIIGKTISAVVVAENKNHEPHDQVFLIFPDGTYFEFYGDQFSCCAGIDDGDVAKACSYAERGGATIRAIYPAGARP